tara:strand:+ start:16 stop:342 length:327 start_codon:yes stop_codon:yes gene_type:complete
MAQDFERHIARATGTGAATLFTSNSDDAVISIRLANIVAASIVVDAYISSGGADYYLVKGITIPNGSSVELIDGASRFVVESGDALKVVSDTASSLDTWVSVVDAISA